MYSIEVPLQGQELDSESDSESQSEQDSDDAVTNDKDADLFLLP